MSDPTRIPSKNSSSGEIQWKRWALGILALLLLIVILQNSQTVEFKFLFISTDAPLILIMVGAAVVGAIIGYATPIMRRHRHNTRREYGKD
ncbi:MAG: LapA family protein [Thermoleophilia bacterium]|nr:LapA family protein [Thermoleophilia bacterium]